MRLRKNCAFSSNNIADMTCLQDDVETMFLKSAKTSNPNPDKFVSYLFAYFKDRPNIQKEIRPLIDLDKFALFMADMHLRATMVSNILSGKEKNPKLIKEYEDDVNEVRRMKGGVDSKSISISSRRTGMVLRDTMKDQEDEVSRAISMSMEKDQIARA